MSAITYDELLTRNLSLIERVCRKQATESSRFVEDLSLDSIDLVSDMEEEFGVIVPEERLRTFRNVGEATRCLYELLTRQEVA